MMKLIRVLAVVAIAFSYSYANAAFTPIGVSIVPPVQFPPSDFSIAGVRVSALWGNHRNVYGFDLGGIGNMTEQNMVGVQASGIFNLNKGQSTVILQAAGAVNINVNKIHVIGLQVAGGVNNNQAESTSAGLMLAGLGNYAPFTTIMGFQVGLYNKAREVYGFQIGLVNVTEKLHGLQIGLLNFNTTGIFSVAPILNVGF